MNTNIRFDEEFTRAYDHVLDVFRVDSRNEIPQILAQRMYRFLYRVERVTSIHQSFVEWIEQEDVKMIYQVLKDWMKETQRIIYPINHEHIANDEIDVMHVVRVGLQISMMLCDLVKDDNSYARQIVLEYIEEFGDVEKLSLDTDYQERIRRIRNMKTIKEAQ
jgi:hypothetical protein